MDKEQIIQLAKSMEFKLDYDRYDDKEYPGVVNPNLKFLRFISKDDSLDEKDLRWIWYKDWNEELNVQNGLQIQSRLSKKKMIQQMLKY